MSSKRVWEVKGYYRANVGMPIAYDTISEALEDVEYLWDAGFGSSMRSYVVPA